MSLTEIEILQNEQSKVATAMKKYGGNFAAALGKALFYADIDNARRIKTAFPELWTQYKMFADTEIRNNEERTNAKFSESQRLDRG